MTEMILTYRGPSRNIRDLIRGRSYIAKLENVSYYGFDVLLVTIIGIEQPLYYWNREDFESNWMPLMAGEVK